MSTPTCWKPVRGVSLSGDRLEVGEIPPGGRAVSTSELPAVACSSRGHGLPHWLRSVLHRSFDFLTDSRDARWEAGGRALSPSCGRPPMCAVRRSSPAGGLRQLAGDGRDVRNHRCRSLRLSGTAGEGHHAGMAMSLGCDESFCSIMANRFLRQSWGWLPRERPIRS